MNSNGTYEDGNDGEVWFTPEGGEEQFLGYAKAPVWIEGTGKISEQYLSQMQAYFQSVPQKLVLGQVYGDEFPDSDYKVQDYIESMNKTISDLAEASGMDLKQLYSGHPSFFKTSSSYQASSPDAQQLASEFCRLVPSLTYQFVDTCPVDRECFNPDEGLTDWWTLKTVIIHMNDQHRTTREEIADWLESLAPEVDINVYEKDSARIQWVDAVNQTAYREFDSHASLQIPIVDDLCKPSKVKPVYDHGLHSHLQRIHGWRVEQLNKAAKNIYERDFT